MNKQLGIAVIGYGYWGGNYVRLFNELPETKVVVVCDTQTERLKEAQQRYPEVAVSTSVEDALRFDGVDAAVVSTTATTHYDVTRRCLENGKHVLVEKPITTIESDAQELITLAEAKERTLMVGHTFIFNSGVRKMKEYVQTDRVGQVYYLYSQRTNLGPIRQDVNALWDLATHDISIFNYLLDDTPRWVSAVGTNVLKNSREDVGFISLGYQNGIIGHVHVSWADPNKVRKTVVVGSKKRVVFDDLNNQERVRVYEKGIAPKIPENPTNYGEYHFEMRDGDIISPRVKVSEPLKNQGKHFVECVKEGIQPLSDGLAGLEVVQVMAAVDRSVELNGVPVPVPNGRTVTATLKQNGNPVEAA